MEKDTISVIVPIYNVEQDNYKGIYDLLSGDYIEPGLWNKLYHKELFEDVCKYRYMIRDNSATSKLSENKIKDPIRVKKIIVDLAEGRILKIAQKALIEACITYYSFISPYNVEDEYYWYLYKELKSCFKYFKLLSTKKNYYICL